MHLTNYSVNKENDDFNNGSGDHEGSKRSIKWFNTWVRDQGDKHVDDMWKDINDVVIKTLIAGVNYNRHAYNLARHKGKNPTTTSHPASDSCCFQLYGFDIFLDKAYKPCVLMCSLHPISKAATAAPLPGSGRPVL